jgi:hypothetical protein
MSIKKLFLVGDSHMSGAGSEWPKLFSYLGPVSKDYRPHLWSRKIKEAYPNLDELYKKFYEDLGPKIAPQQEQRKKLMFENSFGNYIASYLNVEYELLGSNVKYISDILPYIINNLHDEDLKGALIICGVPKVTDTLTYFQSHPAAQALVNKTVPNFAAHIMLIKEFVENRGGKFIYFHTEDFPEELYNPKLNPYLTDLLPLLIFQGDIASILGNDSFWRKFDGKHYDAGTQKVIGQKLGKIVASLL